LKVQTRGDFGSLEQIVVAVADSVRPPERLSVSEAAVKYRYLDNPGSYVGPWTNEKTPYNVEPMDECTSLAFTSMVYVGPARCGKTDLALNWVAHTAKCDPADMMIIHMTQNTARDWSQGDLARMFRHSPIIGATVAPGKHNRNVHDVRFSSGMRILIKWPTITELSAKTIPRIWLTDYDRMPEDVDGEGPPFDLAKKRTQTYRRFGMTVAESSPGRDVEDLRWMPKTAHEAPPARGILELYNRGDRRRWYWRCLSCRKAFEPDFKLFNYPATDDFMEAAEMVTLRCPHCGFDMEPDHKAELNANGRWVKDGQTWLSDGTIVGAAPRTDTASFWLKGPAAAFQDWTSLVFTYLQAQDAYEKTGDEGPLRKTTNTDQGLPYIPKKSETNRLPEDLKNRALNWGGDLGDPVVPVGVRFLIATIDVQAGSRPKFVVQVHGVGVGGDIWLVDMFRIGKSERLDEHGERHLLDPGSYDEDWFILISQVIEKTYPLADGSGRRMQIKMTACDSGGAEGVTANAYNFWRFLRSEHPAGHHRRFMLVKGEPSKSAPHIRVSYPDTSRKDRHAGARGDVPVLFLNSNLIKDIAKNLLGRIEPGGGMVNFPHWAPDWLYVQLTAEVRLAKGWENTRKKRNEAWDLLCYCIALCRHSSIHLEHIDWTDAPGWAKDWDYNDLVFDHETDKPDFVDNKRQTFDLTALGEQLA
jgi:phage terminase large subunit GpA-like protein